MYNLEDSEKRVMSGLFKLKIASVAQLAKETLINRTTLYPILERLLGWGLTTKVNIAGKQMFQAITLAQFEDWVKRWQEDGQSKAKSLLNWARAQAQTDDDSLFSEIKYFEGAEGVKNLYGDTWRDNQGKMIYAITDYAQAYAALGYDFFKQDYFLTRVKHGVRVKNLLPDCADGRRDLKDAAALLREMKFIKLFEDLGIEVNIYDDKIAFVTFDKKRPSGILIKNKKIAAALKNIFEYLWSETK
ncbi:MAG: hypothetical protein WCT40_04235 [Candidatus Magasanikbacteria bacterium]|jgi:sugar-specific transcriptional regulator TrmB